MDLAMREIVPHFAKFPHPVYNYRLLLSRKDVVAEVGKDLSELFYCVIGPVESFVRRTEQPLESAAHED